jgi:hypothetical protein
MNNKSCRILQLLKGMKQLRIMMGGILRKKMKLIEGLFGI